MGMKIKEREVTYFEKEVKFILDYDGREVIIYYYTKQDPQFGDYEGEYTIKDKEKLTEEEQEEIIDYVEDLDIESGEKIMDED